MTATAWHKAAELGLIMHSHNRSSSLWVTEGFQKHRFISCLTGCFPPSPKVRCCFTAWYICLIFQTPLSAMSESCQMDCLVHNSAVEHGGDTARLQVLEGQLSSLGKSLWQVELMVGRKEPSSVFMSGNGALKCGGNNTVYILLQVQVCTEYSCRGHWLWCVFW